MNQTQRVKVPKSMLIRSHKTEVFYKHALLAGVIPHEQRALVREKGGCSNALLIDEMTTGEAREQRKSMSIAWIGYQKAFE